MDYEKAEKFRNRKTLVFLADGKEHFGKIAELRHDRIIMDIPIDTYHTTQITVPLESIKRISPKDTITFLPPKIVLSKETDAAITRHIETIKQEKEFTLTTRKYQLQVNGSKKRTKWSSRDFEKAAAKWLTIKTPIEVFPFALVKVGKQEFLLGVDRAHRIRKITKKDNTILVQQSSAPL
jgi:hypothetical protein